MEIIFSTVEVTHEDERRRLSAIFNGEFIAKQVKLIEIKMDSILGNHYHSYPELFYVLSGEATYTLESVKSKERQVVKLKKGDRLIIGPEIAHKANMVAGTIMIEATEKPYQLSNDVRYELE